MNEVVFASTQIHKRGYKRQQYVQVLLPNKTRQQLAEELQISTRTLQNVLHYAATYIECFDKYVDDEGILRGLPISEDWEIWVIKEILLILKRYKHTRNKAVFVKAALNNLNQQVKDMQNEHDD